MQCVAQARGRWHLWDVIYSCHSEWAKRKNKKGNPFLISTWVTQAIQIGRLFALLAIQGEAGGGVLLFPLDQLLSYHQKAVKWAEMLKVLGFWRASAEVARNNWSLFRLVHWYQHHLCYPRRRTNEVLTFLCLLMLATGFLFSCYHWCRDLWIF